MSCNKTCSKKTTSNHCLRICYFPDPPSYIQISSIGFFVIPDSSCSFQHILFWLWLLFMGIFHVPFFFKVAMIWRVFTVLQCWLCLRVPPRVDRSRSPVRSPRSRETPGRRPRTLLYSTAMQLNIQFLSPQRRDRWPGWLIQQQLFFLPDLRKLLTHPRKALVVRRNLSHPHCFIPTVFQSPPSLAIAFLWSSMLWTDIGWARVPPGTTPPTS